MPHICRKKKPESDPRGHRDRADLKKKNAKKGDRIRRGVGEKGSLAGCYTS